MKRKKKRERHIIDVIEMKIMCGAPCTDRESRTASYAPESRNPFVLRRIVVTVKAVPAGFLGQPVGVVPDTFLIWTMIDKRYMICFFRHGILSFFV